MNVIENGRFHWMLLTKQGVGNGKRMATKPNFNPTNRAVFV